MSIVRPHWPSPLPHLEESGDMTSDRIATLPAPVQAHSHQQKPGFTRLRVPSPTARSGGWTLHIPQTTRAAAALQPTETAA